MLACILLSCFLSVCSPNAADAAKDDFRLAQDRPKIGLVLAPQEIGCGNRQPAQRLAGGIKDVPFTGNGLLLGECR